MKSIKKKCRNCKNFFPPDPRNVKRQKYCFKPECRKASKRASQQKWHSKPENHDYFRGHAHVERVREWRKNNPGYWKKNSKKPLQDSLTAQPSEINNNNGKSKKYALQDFLAMQPAVLIGLIAKFTGAALQDNIEQTLLHLQQLGQDFINFSPIKKGELNDSKISNFTISCTQNTKKFQLDRSPPGP